MPGVEQFAYAGGLASMALACVAQVKWKNPTLTILFIVLACLFAVLVRG